MSYLRGLDRKQDHLLPPCVEDYVAPDAPVRFIDAYVEGIDFKELNFTHHETAGTGRPPYHPGTFCKLYLYGYLNRIRSSRRLEQEAKRNLELIWLLQDLQPDFKTIADFRKNNVKAFKGLFKHFNLLCRKMDLFGAELVAIDGSKFKGVNNSRRHYTDEQLKELVAKIEKRIDEHFAELEKADEQNEGTAGPSKKEMEEKIEELKSRKGKYEEWLKELAQNEEHEKSLTDPDSRKLKGLRGHTIGFNVQVAVDAKHDLIVAEEVVQDANDLGQLAPMALAAKEELGVAPVGIIADAGYHHADHLQKCEQDGLQTYVPDQRRTGGQSRDGKTVFSKQDFVYDQPSDTYLCPAQQKLTRMAESEHRGRPLFHYYNRVACRECQLKAQCTQSPYRKISRLQNEEVVERAAQRVRAHPEWVARRKEVVEHVFGTLRQWGHDSFLMRTLVKVRAEFSLSCLTYNLRRVMNLVSLETFKAALGWKTKVVGSEVI